MTVNLADAPQFPARATLKEQVISGMTVAVGGAGATTETADDPKWTCGAFTSGVAAITFPACPAGRIRGSIVSSGSTVTELIFSALSLTAGTGEITTSKAGVATTPASGNTLFIELIGKVAP